MYQISLILCLFFFISCNQIESKKNEILAEVGKNIINLTDFSFNYFNFLEKNGLNDNLSFRNEFLDKEIDRLLILSLKDSIELNQFSSLFEKIQNIKNQKILNEYFKREVLNVYSPSDSILRDAFIRSKTDINARHLFSKSYEGANQLKAKLEKGNDFNKMAQAIFRDSVLANNGWDLGYFTFGDMDPAFEDAAFSLNDGEISNPIKTKYGYSIIQVLDRWIQPLITEDEFRLRKDKLTSILRNRNQKEIKKSFTQSLKDNINILISDDLLDRLFIDYELIVDDEEYEFKKNYNTIMFRLSDVNDLIERIRRLSSYQKEKIKTKHDLLEALQGTYVREKILSLAKKQDWYYNIKFQKNLKRIKDNETIEYLVNNFFLYEGKTFQEKYRFILENIKTEVSIKINENLLRNLKL